MPDVEDRVDQVALPAEFFPEGLARINDVAELKAVLFVSYLANKGDEKLGVPLNDLLQSDVLKAIVGMLSPEPAELRLRRALEKAIVDGAIFRVKIRRSGHDEVHFLPATASARDVLDRLKDESADAGSELGLGSGDDASVFRPNIFSLYEQQIGALSPLLAEELRDAERSYPRKWIEQAILEAVHYNKRNWRYVQSVLSQWEDSGGPRGIPG